MAEIRGVSEGATSVLGALESVIGKPSPAVDGRLGLKRTTFVIDFYRTDNPEEKLEAYMLAHDHLGEDPEEWRELDDDGAALVLEIAHRMRHWVESRWR